MASKRRLRQKSCTRKIRHAEETHAWAHAKRRQWETGTRFRVYPCPNCGGYHITHIPEQLILQGMIV